MTHFAQAPNGIAKISDKNAGRQPFSRRKGSNLYSLFFIRYITDAVPAMFVSLLLFILPAQKPKFTAWNPSKSDPEQTEEGI